MFSTLADNNLCYVRHVCLCVFVVIDIYDGGGDGSLRSCIYRIYYGYKFHGSMSLPVVRVMTDGHRRYERSCWTGGVGPFRWETTDKNYGNDRNYVNACVHSERPSKTRRNGWSYVVSISYGSRDQITRVWKILKLICATQHFGRSKRVSHYFYISQRADRLEFSQ